MKNEKEMKNYPSEIYLNIDPDSLEDINGYDFMEHEEISWSPSRIHRTDLRYVYEDDYTALAAENEGLKEAMQTFCNRVESGEVRSVKTYNQFKALLKTEQPLPPPPITSPTSSNNQP